MRTPEGAILGSFDNTTVGGRFNGYEKMARKDQEDLLSLGDEALRSSTARFFREEINATG